MTVSLLEQIIKGNVLFCKSNRHFSIDTLCTGSQCPDYNYVLCLELFLFFGQKSRKTGFSFPMAKHTLLEA